MASAEAPEKDLCAVEGLDPENLDPNLLRQRWRRMMGKPAPPLLSGRLMARILAWREQIERTGDVDRATRTKLDAAVSRNSGPVDVSPKEISPNRLRQGTMLVREHGRVLHRVMVLEQGFAWKGQTYGSLSEVARAITGTNWNGYRFFGIKGNRPPRPDVSAPRDSK